ncbi:septum site-determining protein MinC [Pseudomonas aeruginosa]|nr:septum site-determining protein MinC [Pseudomonas aeruginosa]WPE50075.1 septum site-determining protein MinC [Pseudomonas aeruginosa]
MSQADLLDQDPVFQLKGSMLAVTILELAHNDLARLERQLADKVAQAPNFFRDTPLVMALDKLPEGEGRLDLPVLPPSGARERPLDIKDSAPRKPAEEPSPSAGEARPEPAKAEEKPADPVSRPTKVVKTPVRGGMQIYAAGGDLIVLAAVSPGAELLADGNIHVYGPMRGRALAGVKGDATARIFCQQLAAELVSIAGNYKVAEDLRRSPQWGKAVHVSLSGDVLNITRL